MGPSSLKPLSLSVTSLAFISKTNEKDLSAERCEHRFYSSPYSSGPPSSSNVLLPFVNTGVIAFLLLLVVLRVNGKPLTLSSFRWEDCELIFLPIVSNVLLISTDACLLSAVSLLELADIYQLILADRGLTARNMVHKATSETRACMYYCLRFSKFDL